MKLVLNLLEIFGLLLTTVGVIGEARLSRIEASIRQAIKWSSGINIFHKLEYKMASKLLGPKFQDYESARELAVPAVIIIISIVATIFLILKNNVGHFLALHSFEFCLGLGILTILVIGYVFIKNNKPIMGGGNWLPGGCSALLAILFIPIFPLILVLYALPIAGFLITNLIKLPLVVLWGVIWLGIRPYALLDFGVRRLHLQSTIVVFGLLISICAIVLKK